MGALLLVTKSFLQICNCLAYNLLRIPSLKRSLLNIFDRLPVNHLPFLFRPDVVLRLVPSLIMLDRHWKEVAQDVIHKTRNKQTHPVREVIELFHTLWCTDTHVVQEAIEVRDHAHHVRDVGANIPAAGEMVDARLGRGEGVRHVQVSSSNEVVVAEQDAGDGREENLVGCQERDEDGGAAEQVPRIDGEGDDGADEEASADRDVLWKKCRQIIPSWKRVLEYRREDGAVGKHKRDEEAARAVRRSIVLSLQLIQESDRVPYQLTKDDLARGTNDVADQSDDHIGKGKADQITWNDIRWLSGIPLEVRSVGSERGAIRSAEHEKADNQPGLLRAMDR